MPQFAVLIYSDDSAHEPGRTAATSDEIAICDEHAAELTSEATMTAAWAFQGRGLEVRPIHSGGPADPSPA
jgi:hypothetical protein